MTKDLEAFGRKLKQLRLTAGLTSTTLLERLDQLRDLDESTLTITPQLLWNWENAYVHKGRRWTPPKKIVLDLIEIFADYLTRDEASIWASQAGYALGKSELLAIFPATNENGSIKTDELSWSQLRLICQDISQKRMATVQGKYQEALYLTRRKARQDFENFLNSDKRCFVLVGKSGVGKSNFLLALKDDLQKSREDICILMYDSINLSLSPAINQTIAEDINIRLDLKVQPLKDIWAEINRIKDVEARKIILCVDAVNEHHHAKELLRQLDELVQAPWPWLKIVFSSRPETWQVIKRGVRISEALYYRHDNETIGVTLEPFSFSQYLEDFSRQELPEVYGRYRAVFELETPFEALNHRLREILRDPLSLWLVSQTYRQQGIPNELERTVLIEKYVNALLSHEMIRREDLRLLKESLVPLMVRGEDFSNNLSISEINRVDRDLQNLILNEQLLDNGHPMNQSFTNLCDADILAWQPEEPDPKLSFKYERFYEYFVGQHLFGLSKDDSDKPEFFLRHIEQTTNYPFLWGAVKNALIQETRENGTGIALLLCYTDRPRVKEMIVDVLNEFGQDNKAAMEDLLNKLLHPKMTVSRIQSIRQLLASRVISQKLLSLWNLAQDQLRNVSRILTHSKRRNKVHFRNAQKAAIEVATQLRIPLTLETAALHPDTTIRTTAVRYAYRLWQNDPRIGFEILERLARRATPGLIPHPIAFEMAFWLSLLILFDSPQDKMVLARLRDIWRKAIIKLLAIHEAPGRLERWGRGFIRELLLGIAVTITLKQLDGLGGHSIVNTKDLAAFFQLNSAHKILSRRLIKYVDVHGDYSREQMEQDLLAALPIRDMLIEGVVLMALAAHSMYYSPREVMPLLSRLIQEARKDPLPTPYLSGICDLIFTTSMDQVMSDEVFNFFVETVESCQIYYTEHATIPNLQRDQVYYGAQAMYVGPYVFNRFQRDGTIGLEWLEPRIKIALRHKDMNFFKFLLKTELPGLGLELQRPQLALDVVALFFDIDDGDIHELIYSFLSHLRTYYPNEVDEFLETYNASPKYQLQVRTNEPDEELSWLIGLRVWKFVAHELIGGPPILRNALIQLYERASNCQNLREWVNSGFRDLVNVVYGEEILRIKSTQL